MSTILKFPAEKAKDNERALSHTRQYLEHLYARFSLNGCKYQWYDGQHPITQQIQFMGADASLVCKKTADIKYVEEKADFHLPNNFCLEIESNTVVTPHIPGWALTSQADRLVYSFIWLEDILDVFILDFPQLRRWLSHQKNYERVGKPWTVPGSPNETYSRIVPIPVVTERVNTYRYLITARGEVLPVPITGQPPVNIVPRVLSRYNIAFKRLAERNEALA